MRAITTTSQMPTAKWYGSKWYGSRMSDPVVPEPDS